MFLLNSRLAFLSAAPESCTREGSHLPGRPISRSYRALLSSSLAEVRPNALGHLSQPTSGGLRYGRPNPIAREAFLVGMGSTASQARRLSYPLPSARSAGADLPTPAWPTVEDAYYQSRALPTLPRPLSALKRDCGGAGILTCCPSPSAVAYGLGPTNPTPINVA